MRIAAFGAEHIEACAAMYHRLFTSPDWNFDWLTIENTRRYFIDLSSAPRFKGFAYLDGDITIGACFGEISDYFSTVQYTIKEIFIDPLLQGKGLGSGFLIRVEEDLKKNKVDNVILSTSRSIKAYDFYIKNGYIESPETVFLVKFINKARQT